MILTFTLFLVSLAIIGFLVIYRLLTIQPTVEGNISAWYIPNMQKFQGYVWHALLTIVRWILVITVVQFLLFVERVARFLARKTHTIIEKKLHYNHEHYE